MADLRRPLLLMLPLLLTTTAACRRAAGDGELPVDTDTDIDTDTELVVDSDTDLLIDTGPCRPIDLADPYAVWELVWMWYTMPALGWFGGSRFGTLEAGGGCPSVAFQPDGSIRYEGGCSTTRGVSFDGALTIAPDGVAFDLDDWRADRIAFLGSVAVDGDYRFESRIAGNRETFDGTIRADAEIFSRVAPQGAVGTGWYVDRTDPGADVAPHEYGGTIDVTCRSSVTATFVVTRIDGMSSPDVPRLGTGMFEAEGRRVEVDWSNWSDVTRCWRATLDDEPFEICQG